MTVSTEARNLAERCLARALPRRWRHVKAVARKAESVAELLLAGSDVTTLAAAAWLHDVGYAPDLALTGFHSLDGARWLRAQGFDERVTALVAHHSCAHREAAERGLADQLAAEFEREESVVADGLWYADMTTGPDGQDLDVIARLGEIHVRYGHDHLVSRFISRATPEIIAVVRRTEKRLNAASQPM